jgi:hypothetical protein
VLIVSNFQKLHNKLLVYYISLINKILFNNSDISLMEGTVRVVQLANPASSGNTFYEENGRYFLIQENQTSDQVVGTVLTRHINLKRLIRSFV